MDELFEALTLIQTNIVPGFPVIMMGKKYWGKLLGWLKDTMLAEGAISKEDIDLIYVTDDPEEVMHIIVNYYDKVKR